MSQKIHSDTNPTNTIKFITSILFSCILYPTKTSNCFSIVFYISRYDPLSTYLSLKCMLALTVPSFIRALQSSLKSELHMSSLLSLSQPPGPLLVFWLIPTLFVQSLSDSLFTICPSDLFWMQIVTWHFVLLTKSFKKTSLLGFKVIIKKSTNMT